MQISAPREWQEVLDDLRDKGGLAVLLGATDTGKSTLARFLVSGLCREDRRIALVDADVGQSSLGPPTTVGLALFDSPPDWGHVSALEIFFTGATSPERNLSLHLRGTGRMAEKAVSLGAGVVIVDTTGLVHGELGKELKRRKIDLLSPRLVLALQRNAEIEPILQLYQGVSSPRIYRLPVSDKVRVRSREERALYRAERFRFYFKGSETREWMTDGLNIQGEVTDSDGLSVPLGRVLQVRGLLLGLKDADGNTLALGVIERFDQARRRLHVSTPASARSAESVKALQLGSLKLTPAFEEERWSLSVLP